MKTHQQIFHKADRSFSGLDEPGENFEGNSCLQILLFYLIPNLSIYIHNESKNKLSKQNHNKKLKDFKGKSSEIELNFLIPLLF